MGLPAKKARRDAGATVRMICEACGVALVADAKHAGKRTKCRRCGAPIVIPEPAARQEETPPRTRAASERLRLQEGTPATEATKENAPTPSPSDSAPLVPTAAAAAVVQSIETHRMRSKVAGWLRRVVIVVLAFAVIKVFEACFSSVLVVAPADLHSAVRWVGEAILSIPGSLRLLTVERPVEVGQLIPIERFMLGLAMLIYATRLVVRTKLLDAVYVTSPRWQERTVSGLVVHFLAALMLAGLLAWAASATQDPTVSDGLTCGLIATMLLASALWLVTLHLVAGNEYPELTKWMATDGAFAILIILVTVWPGLTVLWSRAGAVAVLLLADSAVALHVGTSFVFARRGPRWWWRKPLSIVVSVVLLFLAAVLLACIR